MRLSVYTRAYIRVHTRVTLFSRFRHCSRRYDCAGRLAPYILSGLTDPSPSVRLIAGGAIEASGREWEEEHVTELLPLVQYGVDAERGRDQVEVGHPEIEDERTPQLQLRATTRWPDSLWSRTPLPPPLSDIAAAEAAATSTSHQPLRESGASSTNGRVGATSTSISGASPNGRPRLGARLWMKAHARRLLHPILRELATWEPFGGTYNSVISSTSSSSTSGSWSSGGPRPTPTSTLAARMSGAGDPRRRAAAMLTYLIVYLEDGIIGDLAALLPVLVETLAREGGQRVPASTTESPVLADALLARGASSTPSTSKLARDASHSGAVPSTTGASSTSSTTPAPAPTSTSTLGGADPCDYDVTAWIRASARLIGRFCPPTTWVPICVATITSTSGAAALVSQSDGNVDDGATAAHRLAAALHITWLALLEAPRTATSTSAQALLLETPASMQHQHQQWLGELLDALTSESVTAVANRILPREVPRALSDAVHYENMRALREAVENSSESRDGTAASTAAAAAAAEEEWGLSSSPSQSAAAVDVVAAAAAAEAGAATSTSGWKAAYCTVLQSIAPLLQVEVGRGNAKETPSATTSGSSAASAIPSSAYASSTPASSTAATATALSSSARNSLAAATASSHRHLRELQLLVSDDAVTVSFHRTAALSVILQKLKLTGAAAAPAAVPVGIPRMSSANFNSCSQPQSGSTSTSAVNPTVKSVHAAQATTSAAVLSPAPICIPTPSDASDVEYDTRAALPSSLIDRIAVVLFHTRGQLQLLNSLRSTAKTYPAGSVSTSPTSLHNSSLGSGHQQHQHQQCDVLSSTSSPAMSTSTWQRDVMAPLQAYADILGGRSSSSTLVDGRLQLRLMDMVDSSLLWTAQCAGADATIQPMKLKLTHGSEVVGGGFGTLGSSSSSNSCVSCDNSDLRMQCGIFVDPLPIIAVALEGYTPSPDLWSLTDSSEALLTAVLRQLQLQSRTMSLRQLQLDHAHTVAAHGQLQVQSSAAHGHRQLNIDHASLVVFLVDMTATAIREAASYIAERGGTDAASAPPTSDSGCGAELQQNKLGVQQQPQQQEQTASQLACESAVISSGIASSSTCDLASITRGIASLVRASREMPRDTGDVAAWREPVVSALAHLLIGLRLASQLQH